MIRTNIRTKAILLSVVPLAFLLVLLALALSLQNHIDRTAAWSHESAGILNQSALVMKTLEDGSRSVVTYASSHRPSSLDGLRQASLAMPMELAALRRLTAQEPAQAVRAAQLSAQMRQGFAILNAYARDLETGQGAKARALGASPATRSLSAHLNATDANLEQRQREMTIARFEELRSQLQTFGLVLVLCCVVGILLTLFTTARFGFGIAHRLQILADNARRLGAGETTAPIGGNDEIVDLDTAYHDMARRIAREHDVATMLQRALLPQELPKIPGLRIDTAYMPAARDTEIGGDWYDVFSISPSHVGISVGDVAGHGLRAATTMGAVRQAVRTAARVEADPATVLGHVNRSLCADDGDVVTAFLGILELRSGRLRYSIAGHPPPLIVSAAGVVEPLEEGGLVLGADRGARYAENEICMPANTGILLYTDGIIEVERDYFKGMRDLHSAFEAEHAANPPNLAEAIQERIFARAEPRDDSAILFVGITGNGAAPALQRRTTWTVDANVERDARRVKREVVRQISASVLNHGDLSCAELILGELLGNVARHTPGTAEVTLECERNRAVLHILDRGRPFSLKGRIVPDVLAENGRGLFLVRTLALEVVVERVCDGNRISAVLPVA
ncbi:MAG: SpoIIE family protein phosphatase [Candidatus Eremiobacteraeota bacterium]|nr:SpoIIE family protein phosphatase [Candidatus Eremiobacteraeota bacterium]